MKTRLLALALTVVGGISMGSVSQDAAAIPILSQTAPGSISYTFGTDFQYMSFSSVGDVTANVTAVDLALGIGNSSTSGCQTGDFAGFAGGHIALIQRGACSFQLKAENAAAAGAVGALIFNQGNTIDPGRNDVFSGTLSSFYTGGIPVLSLSYSLGEILAGTSGLAVRMLVDVSEPPPPAVPEPTTLLLLGLGLAGLGFARRRLH